MLRVIYKSKLWQESTGENLYFALKISLMRVISLAFPAGPIFDRPKIGEKGAATFEARGTKQGLSSPIYPSFRLLMAIGMVYGYSPNLFLPKVTLK